MKVASVSQLVLLSALLTADLGCRAKVPSSTEASIVDWTKHHVTVGGRSDVNPVPALPDNIDDGKQAFASYCMVCHGLDGQNTGVPFAGTLSPPVPSLAGAEVQTYTDGQLKWIIKNGLYPSGMPPAGKDFSDDDIWRMVLYIRHLPPKGSLGDPVVYGGTAK